MASTTDPGVLTNRQIGHLAHTISADSMESIAEGYMDIDDATIRNIRRDASNSEAFNRSIIKHWKNMNPDDQVKVVFFTKISYYQTKGKSPNQY